MDAPSAYRLLNGSAVPSDKAPLPRSRTTPAINPALESHKDCRKQTPPSLFREPSSYHLLQFLENAGFSLFGSERAHYWEDSPLPDCLYINLEGSFHAHTPDWAFLLDGIPWVNELERTSHPFELDRIYRQNTHEGNFKTYRTFRKSLINTYMKWFCASVRYQHSLNEEEPLPLLIAGAEIRRWLKEGFSQQNERELLNAFLDATNKYLEYLTCWLKEVFPRDYDFIAALTSEMRNVLPEDIYTDAL